MFVSLHSQGSARDFDAGSATRIQSSDIVDCDSATYALVAGSAIGCQILNLEFSNGLAKTFVASLSLNRERQSPSYEFVVYESSADYSLNTVPLMAYDSEGRFASSFLNFEAKSQFLVVDDIDQDGQIEAAFAVNAPESRGRLTRFVVLELQFSDGQSMSYREEGAVSASPGSFHAMSGVAAYMRRMESSTIIALPQARQILVKENIVRKSYKRFQSGVDSSGASTWTRIEDQIFVDPLNQ